MTIRAYSLTLTLCIVLGMAGCAAPGHIQQRAHEQVRPQSLPVRNITSFTPALRCMDNLLAHYYPPGEPSTLYSKGVIDKTGKDIGGDNREILMSTIAELSARSNLFQFADLPTTLHDLQVTSHHFAPQPPIADYEIIAAISQMDENVSAKSQGVSLSLPFLDASYSADQNVTVLAVDFLISKPRSRVVKNGITAKNAIAIVRTGKAGDLGGQIKKAGFFYNLSIDRSEGLYAALRALIELSTIEVLGKLAEVPYWQCLQIDATHPDVLGQTHQWFAKMSSQKRIRFVQKMLRSRGHYRGPLNGKMTTTTRNAIARYQQAIGHIPTGRIDLNLYRHLIGNDTGDRIRLAAAQPAQDPHQPPPAATATAVKPTLELSTPRGPQPRYQAQDTVALIATVSQPAYLYCFYRDAGGHISKIYPNRFQPQAQTQPSTPLVVPGAAPFSLRLDHPGQSEDILCLASPQKLDAYLPQALVPDLQPLSVSSLDQIQSVFGKLQPALADARLVVKVL